jgi:hypothetical protein
VYIWIFQKTKDDGKYVSLEKGDDIDLVYNEIPSYEDWNRDFVVRIKGYYNYKSFEEQADVLLGIKEWLQTFFDKDYIQDNLDKILEESHFTLYADFVSVNVSYLTGPSSLHNAFISQPLENDSFAREVTFPMTCSASTGGGASIGLGFQFKKDDKWYNIPEWKDEGSGLNNEKTDKSEIIEKIKNIRKISVEELKQNKNPGLEKEWVRIYYKNELQFDYAISLQLDVTYSKKNYIEAVVTSLELEKLREKGLEVEILAFNKGDVFSEEDFEDYHSYNETVVFLQEIEAKYPSLAKMYDIGESIENRTIWAMKISDNVLTDEEEPEVFIVGNHHAREVMTVEIPLYQIQYLVENYNKEYVPTKLVDEREIWFVPTMNPDGL